MKKDSSPNSLLQFAGSLSLFYKNNNNNSTCLQDNESGIGLRCPLSFFHSIIIRTSNRQRTNNWTWLVVARRQRPLICWLAGWARLINTTCSPSSLQTGGGWCGAWPGDSPIATDWLSWSSYSTKFPICVISFCFFALCQTTQSFNHSSSQRLSLISYQPESNRDAQFEERRKATMKLQ